MSTQHSYPIGRPNQPWNETEKKEWLDTITVKRAYSDEVLSKLQSLDESNPELAIVQYGSLSHDVKRYPLHYIKTAKWDNNKPNVLVTGGVHGYETSGVQGALLFAKDHVKHYLEHFNFIIVPCVSPWGYETINRWNPLAIDPNRSFYANSPAEESAKLMALVNELGHDFLVHIDLHETTDTDESEFRPALAARDGKAYEADIVPDGFYTVGDSNNPQIEFQNAVIEAVKQVTHIAPPDSNNQIIGSDVVEDGVILYPMKQLGLCGGLTHCQFGTTTEVYPDSPKVNDEECNLAQVAAIRGGLDFVIAEIANTQSA